MSVFRPKGKDGRISTKVYRYNFAFKGKRYSKSTGLTTKREAEKFESDLIRKLREQAAGVAITDPSDSPRIQDWADVALKDARRRTDHPERLEQLLRRVLQFFGAAPRGAVIDPLLAPYHNLTLAQVAQNPDWVIKFEDWLERQTVATGPYPKDGSPRARQPMAAQTQNQHRSAVSVMFDLAASPLYRKRTGVIANPFAGVPRPRGRRRVVALTIPQIGLWLEHASRHVALSMVIAVLAPKLRLGNVLGLRWSQIDADYTQIMVTEHKTARDTGRPLVVRISAPLRQLLKAIRKDQPRRATHVILYRGRPIESINDGVRNAAARAGVPYGLLTDDGATFHTIRHSLATLLARLHREDDGPPLTMDERMGMLGHLIAGTTLWYTHLGSDAEQGATDRIGAIAAPLVDVALTRRRRAAGGVRAVSAESGADDQREGSRG